MTQEPTGRTFDVSDHPGPLGDLAEIFARRRIAVCVDCVGQTFLVRPDSVIFSVQDGETDAIAAAIETFNALDPDGPTAKIRSIPPDLEPEQGEVPVLDLVAVDLDIGERPRTTINGELRWSLQALNTLRAHVAEQDDSLKSQVNHVFLGSQGIIGNPLGAPASFAGEVAFVAKTTNLTPDGRMVMLSTAEPSVAPTTLRAALELSGHTRPRVLVMDTGLETLNALQAAHEALRSACVVGDYMFRSAVTGEVDDEDEQDDDRNGTLDFEAGHGTFISGVIRQIAPDAEIYSAGVLSSFGDGDVFHVLTTLRRLLAKIGPVDIVVMSFGLFFDNDDPGFFGLALPRQLRGALGVAAAGNQQTCRPYFPAALPDILGVGGLAASGKAWFSNFGPWVDACAPAVDVVSTFFTDAVEYIDGSETRHWDGWARWSGTSFAAPKVAALIAQEMYLHGGTAKEAWKRLTSHKQLRYPDLGIVFNV